MASLLQVDLVKYKCHCGAWEPLAKLYFDRVCSAFRCHGCVMHEIDSCFCSHCLETMPTAEARNSRNRCRTCLECPVCDTTLILRATTLLPAEHQANQAAHLETADPLAAGRSPVGGANKAFYLNCPGCFWNSRYAGLPDQSQASTAGWPKPVSAAEQQLEAALSHYKQLAAIEKTEKDRQVIKRRAHPMFYSDKFGLSSLYARKHMGGHDWKNEKTPTEDKEMCLAKEDVPELPEELLTQPIDITKVSSLRQRLQQPINQPHALTNVLPAHKRVMIRRSLRCRDCEHSLCKPEYSPNSYQFKIQSFAMLHAPEIRMLRAPDVQALGEGGKDVELCLTIQNLSAALMHVSLLPDECHSDQPVQPKLPECEFVVPHRDDNLEFDENVNGRALSKQYKDDPSVVLHRKQHKLAFKMSINSKQAIQSDEPILLHLLVKYDYMSSALPGIDTHAPEQQWFTRPLQLVLRA